MCPKRSGEVPISKVSIEEYRPYVDTDQYPLEFVEKHALLKLKEDDRLVSVGVCGPLNTGLLEDLKNFHRKQIRCFRIDRSDLSAWMGEKMSDISEDRNLEEIFLTHGESILIDKLAPDAPTVNLVNSILIDGIRKEASDIHIEVDGEETLVRYRIDGYLHIMHRFGRERFREVSSRIKIMANLNIVERRLPQDGRITVHLDSDLFDLRVSIVPIVGGESIVLRLFNKKRTPLEIDQLGLSSGSLSQIKSLFRKTQGLVLVTGPTGSGKTTTLNAILREIRSESTKIITIEDPVEYITDGIDQIQTNEKIGLTFDSILKRVLRQDPNIIMVGEIRDMPTAELSVRAALTGHLVFSTLHTKDSVSVITRLKNMGIESYLIGAVLKGAVAQRLVRKICPDAKRL